MTDIVERLRSVAVLTEEKATQMFDEAADEIGRLRNALNAAAGALTYYTEVDYDVSSDVQAGYGIEVLDEIEGALCQNTDGEVLK